MSDATKTGGNGIVCRLNVAALLATWPCRDTGGMRYEMTFCKVMPAKTGGALVMATDSKVLAVYHDTKGYCTDKFAVTMALPEDLWRALRKDRHGQEQLTVEADHTATLFETTYRLEVHAGGPFPSANNQVWEWTGKAAAVMESHEKKPYVGLPPLNTYYLRRISRAARMALRRYDRDVIGMRLIPTGADDEAVLCSPAGFPHVFWILMPTRFVRDSLNHLQGLFDEPETPGDAAK